MEAVCCRLYAVSRLLQGREDPWYVRQEQSTRTS